MTTGPRDLDPDLRAILEEEAAEAPAEAFDLEAALADPTLAALIERTIQPRAHLLSEKGKAHLRRTLARVFTTDPGAAALLAKVREQGGMGTSGPKPAGEAGAPTKRRRRMR
jgi:hypothetical protein